jgi:hypothetical protein
MERLTLLWEQEHLLLVVGSRRFVLDTGSPMSFGEGGAVTCDGNSVPLPTSLAGLSAATLSGFLGGPVDGLLGNDFIACFDWRFDLPNGTATASREPLLVAGTRVPLRFVQTVPVMQGQVAGQTVSLLFDSGAKLSYLERSLTTGFPDAGTVNDFMPMFGAFTAATVHAPMLVSGRAFTLRFGAAPQLVQLALTMTGSSGIVGAELLQSCAVGYAPRRSELVLA